MIGAGTPSCRRVVVMARFREAQAQRREGVPAGSKLPGLGQQPAARRVQEGAA